MAQDTSGQASKTPAKNGPEAERIDVNAEPGLRGWAKKFDATPMQIKEAVQAVGDCAADVEMHLKGTHSTTNADREARVGGAEGKAGGSGECRGN